MAAAAGEEDSDLEVETEVPSLESILGWEVVRHLKPKEKKRQEVINGEYRVCSSDHLMIIIR